MSICCLMFFQHERALLLPPLCSSASLFSQKAFSIVFPPLRFESYWQDTTNKYTFKIAIGIGDERGKRGKKRQTKMNNSVFALTTATARFREIWKSIIQFSDPYEEVDIASLVQRDYFGNQAQGLMLKQHRKIGRKTAFFFFLNFSEIHILGYFSVFFFINNNLHLINIIHNIPKFPHIIFTFLLNIIRPHPFV